MLNQDGSAIIAKYRQVLLLLKLQSLKEMTQSTPGVFFYL